jgi:5'-nucleotidase / UDP-sugar diphosphatase
MGTKRFTLLHSNDMHGDFYAEAGGAQGNLIGGLSLLSGYVQQVRRTEENVLYVVAGDMVQGSIIDSEYKGVSTIEIMNYLAPDVASLGNHEFDYGLSHLLFLEKMANFPIVNANLYLRPYHKRLMTPYVVLNRAGLDIMFIGIVTETVIGRLAMDEIGSFVTLEDAADEVGRICNAYRDADIDLTVLLTHIGFDSDKELAALLKPEWGVDCIIGGHSHTILEQPERINGIPIVQAGVGTDQIGRFDVIVDDDTNAITHAEWRLIPVDSTLAKPDQDLQKYIDSYKEQVDRKYNAILTRLTTKLTHPHREIETSLGDFFSDILAQRAGVDIMFMGSGSIRGKEFGPVVTLGDLRTLYPYDGPLYKSTVTGEQLLHVFGHIMRPENRTGEGECFQVNKGVQAVYSESERKLVSLKVGDRPVDPEWHYRICIQDYHFKNVQTSLGLSHADLTALTGSQVVTTSTRDVLEEHMTSQQNLSAAVEGRLVYQ